MSSIDVWNGQTENCLKHNNNVSSVVSIKDNQPESILVFIVLVVG